MPGSDAMLAVLLKRPDYVKILMCLEEPKIISEVISCALESGVEVSPSTIKVKIVILERWGLIKMERVGKNEISKLHQVLTKRLNNEYKVVKV